MSTPPRALRHVAANAELQRVGHREQVLKRRDGQPDKREPLHLRPCLARGQPLPVLWQLLGSDALLGEGLLRLQVVVKALLRQHLGEKCLLIRRRLAARVGATHATLLTKGLEVRVVDGDGHVPREALVAKEVRLALRRRRRWRRRRSTTACAKEARQQARRLLLADGAALNRATGAALDALKRGVVIVAGEARQDAQVGALPVA